MRRIVRVPNVTTSADDDEGIHLVRHQNRHSCEEFGCEDENEWLIRLLNDQIAEISRVNSVGYSQEDGTLTYTLEVRIPRG